MKQQLYVRRLVSCGDEKDEFTLLISVTLIEGLNWIEFELDLNWIDFYKSLSLKSHHVHLHTSVSR